MTEYDFTLKFILPNPDMNPEQFVEALYEAGCDDAIIGTGKNGYLALNFIREATSAYEAVASAITDVKSVISEAKLLEAAPDFVGVTDVAALLGCSRQNIRKLMVKHNTSFPQPIHQGSIVIWHLANILPYFKTMGNYKVDNSLLELSKTNMQINLAREMRELGITSQHIENFVV
ncbi:MAG: hypothetical protein RL368_1173 [Pseudomonadota bacterium]|jgi:predicted DNA-binding transcriptional regulator AlpA